MHKNQYKHLKIVFWQYGESNNEILLIEDMQDKLTNLKIKGESLKNRNFLTTFRQKPQYLCLIFIAPQVLGLIRLILDPIEFQNRL